MPIPPTITNVVDDGNADSATVSITGTDTIQLYYRQKSTTTWTAGLTRAGSGDIVQTGLIAGTWYEFYATSDDGTESAPSNQVQEYIAVTSGTGTLKQAIAAMLMGDDTVFTLTSGNIGPGGDPTRSKSSVTFHQISDVPAHTMSGPDTLHRPTMQVNSYGASDFDAETLAVAVISVLDGFSGTVNGVAISYMALEDEGDLDDYEPENKEVSRHGVRQDYIVSYTRN